jgi:hypothetical protein
MSAATTATTSSDPRRSAKNTQAGSSGPFEFLSINRLYASRWVLDAYYFLCYTLNLGSSHQLRASACFGRVRAQRLPAHSLTAATQRGCTSRQRQLQLVRTQRHTCFIRTGTTSYSRGCHVAEEKLIFSLNHLQPGKRAL